MTNAMPNYSFFLSQMTSLTYVPIFGTVVILGLMKEGVITDESRSFPKFRFAVMGGLDASAGILMLVGGAMTAGSTQLVLQQAMIPVALVMTRLTLGTRYNISQTLGAFIIILGVVVFKLPDLLHKGDHGPGEPADVFAFNLLFVLACVPLGLSQVYKEVAFRDVEMDVNYMQFWVALFQTSLGLTLAPINSLPMLGPQTVPLRDIPMILYNGTKCLFLLHNTVVDDCGGPGQVKCDTCGDAWVSVTMYLAFNVLYNVFTLLVVKHGSATLSFLVATLRLPLSSFAFYSHKLMGAAAQTPRLSDFCGLAVLLGGLVCYRIGSAKRRKSKQEEDSEVFTRHVYRFSTIMETEPAFVRVYRPRSPEHIRSHYYWKLSVAFPHESPTLRPLAEPLLVSTPTAREEGDGVVLRSPTQSPPEPPIACP
eukprot:GHVO01021509.1.p1 GENE.GHVO01021509.1~~GHVO01021509.1.p1  ORF type:complete len:486 (-),score=78.14 GHVO01021509.1:389-1657(-)